MSKATIVIPNINGKGWLKDSIESIYAQTEQDFDLIVVDNGSTDESLEQARSYCTRPNFTLIENGRNTGFSYAVNQGIARAQSKYVVLFNNDPPQKETAPCTECGFKKAFYADKAFSMLARIVSWSSAQTRTTSPVGATVTVAALATRY